MSLIPYGVVSVVFPIVGFLILWRLRLYGESTHDTQYSFWLSIAVAIPCLLFLLMAVLRSRAFDNWVDYFKTDEENLEPTKEYKINAHPVVSIGLVWMILGIPTIFSIDQLPNDSELRTLLVILAYFASSGKRVGDF